MIEIIPSILTDNPRELHELLDQSNEVVERVHIDIIDGIFADNKTVLPDALEDMDHLISWDFHLMVDEPAKWVRKCVHAGADCVIGQIEMMGDQREFIELVAAMGASPGLAIDEPTSIDYLTHDILDSVDVILVMSVPAGFGGQRFHPSALSKIEKLQKLKQEKSYTYLICDDGGVTLDRIDDVASAQADQVVIGRRLFDGDLSANIEKFQKASVA